MFVVFERWMMIWKTFFIFRAFSWEFVNTEKSFSRDKCLQRRELVKDNDHIFSHEYA